MKGKKTTQGRGRATGADASLCRHGGLSYLEIPAIDPRQSAAFYARVVGWKVDDADAQAPKFTDAGGHLIGRWVNNRPIAREPGLMPYIYVNDIAEALSRVAPNGGQIVKPRRSEGDLWVATIRDPAGNLIGLWQDSGR
jgi:hypothetical protein